MEEHLREYEGIKDRAGEGGVEWGYNRLWREEGREWRGR